MSQTKPIVLSSNDWNTSSIKYMAPKINEKGGKSINMISTQSNRTLHISTPLLMTWGVADFIDEKGESDGKFSLSLNFPSEDYKTAQTDLFLKKLKDFENQILDDAVKNSDSWWGEEMSREVAKHTFFPFIKYSKNKDTKKIDYSKPPSIRAKVPFYNGKWAVEIYDTKSDLIFPCENTNLTPVDFIPKMSNVACVLQCGGIWIGGKGWGLTWKLIQCIVKPREVVSVYGKCQIQLSSEDRSILEKQELKEYVEDEEVELQQHQASKNTKPAKTTNPINVTVEDSDDEKEVVLVAPIKPTRNIAGPPTPQPPAVETSVKEDVVSEEEVVEVAAPEAVVAAATKKKVIKKVAPK